MKIKGTILFTIMVAYAFCVGSLAGQELPVSGIDPEALIDQILVIDGKQRAEISDLTLDAEYIGGQPQKDGSVKEKKRFLKKVYIKYLPDTTWYREEYLECYRDSQMLNPEECRKAGIEQIENNRKRHICDISYNVLHPFYPESRGDYDILYRGVASDRVDGYVCHHFRVECRGEPPDGINGDYYFEAESFHLVRVDFTPVKLVRRMMFKLSRLDMSIRYGPNPDGWWLPRQLDVEGRGKSTFIFGVKFVATEYFRHPEVNSGLSDEIFEVNHD